MTALALLAAYVEGVRDGFERWGDDAAEVIEGDGVYKLTNDLLVEKDADASTVYMVLPSVGTSREATKTWRESAPNSKVDLAEVSESGYAKLAAIDAAVVSTSNATLRDFLAYYDASLMNPRVLVGVFLGAMSTFLFCAMTMKSVGRAAQGMVIEVRRQFDENPGILDGSVKPDYERPISISTIAAQQEMILPSLLGLMMPIVVGILLGVAGVLGLLTGCLTSGFCLAVFMSNSGGSWDNAKKYIEADHHGGKGSEAHKAAVVGDTVGDPFKDTSGPSLNILIKLMSMVSVVVAGLVVRYSLVAMGIF